ncbi:MAG: hypothetical protein WBP59_14050 [Ilumatobacteraceae bacterium]
MTIVTVIGDCTTTTSVALASCWPAADDVIVVEADPSGGSLSGWLDTPASPSLATLVAALGSDDGGSTLDTVMAMTHRSAAGIRFLAAPVRSTSAHRALAESARVVAALAPAPMTVLADIGRLHGADPLSAIVRSAAANLIVHRQVPASAAAAAVRIERLVETIEHVAATGSPCMLAVIGAEPFDPAEIAAFVNDSMPGRDIEHVHLADDPLAAAVVAGRTGVSAKRLNRLPLMRSATTTARRLLDLSTIARRATSSTEEQRVS